MNIGSSIPPAPALPLENLDAVDMPDMREVANEKARDSYKEVVLLVSANAAYISGDYAEALELYDRAIEAGSVESKLYRGFLVAEMACDFGNRDKLIDGLKEALGVMAKMLEHRFICRLRSVLQKAARSGLLDYKRQLSVGNADAGDVYDRIVDVIKDRQTGTASLENLLEYLEVYEEGSRSSSGHDGEYL